ncbi:phage tail assembly protein [Pseudomonas fluorescens]|uniref:phage tail assembly protein n=1 Tax=Pseudomonas fluorescens TaxID=294 RepID=UPI0035237BDD
MTQINLNKPLPSWLVLTDDGVTVTLAYKANIGGVVVDKLTMRAPSVKDMEAAKAASGGELDKLEKSLFCSLLMASDAELTALKIKDYNRLSAGYFRLVEDDDL